jgi:hypothetical protein
MKKKNDPVEILFDLIKIGIIVVIGYIIIKAIFSIPK